MNSQDVRNWMMNPNRSYEVGVQIFELFAPAKSSADLAFFKQNMQAPAGTLHFNMLYQKVSAILPKVESLELIQTLPAEPAQRIEIKKTPFIEKGGVSSDKSRFDATKYDINQLPEPLQQKYKENQLITAELSSLRADLEHASTDEERQELADAICVKDDLRASNWAEIDAFFEDQNSISEILMAEINKCKTYISRCYNSKSEPVQEEIKKRIAFLEQNDISINVENGIVSYGKKA